MSSGATCTVRATARYGFSRRVAPSVTRSMSCALRSMRTWKWRCPGSTPRRFADLAVRQRDGLVAEQLQHAQAQRMAKGLQLLRTVDREDVENVCQRRAHALQ